MGVEPTLDQEAGRASFAKRVAASRWRTVSSESIHITLRLCPRGRARPRCLAWRVSNLRRYDLNLLLSLHALLHTRNVTQAGEWLGFTPAAHIEATCARCADFQDELLVRIGREYQLTPLASALVEPLTHAVAEIERAITDARPSIRSEMSAPSQSR